MRRSAFKLADMQAAIDQSPHEQTSKKGADALMSVWSHGLLHHRPPPVAEDGGVSPITCSRHVGTEHMISLQQTCPWQSNHFHGGILSMAIPHPRPHCIKASSPPPPAASPPPLGGLRSCPQDCPCHRVSIICGPTPREQLYLPHLRIVLVLLAAVPRPIRDCEHAGTLHHEGNGALRNLHLGRWLCAGRFELLPCQCSAP